MKLSAFVFLLIFFLFLGAAGTLLVIRIGISIEIVACTLWFILLLTCFLAFREITKK